MFGLGMTEILILMVLGVLLFGKRLPEVGRSIGKMLVEFRRGLAGFEESLEGGHLGTPRYEPLPSPPARPPQRIQPIGPKFEDEPPATPTSI
jgi:sec-independent protein translocase protein TatA